MKKIITSLGILVLALSVVGLAAGNANGRDLVKVPLIKYSGPEFGGGMVVFNGGKEKVSVDVEVKGLTPNYDYTVFLEINYGLAGWYYPNLGTMRTDENGNGKWEGSYPLPAGTYKLGLDVADHVLWAAEYITSNMLNSVTVDPGTGFDQFGYNYNARIFVGKADGVDRVLDGLVWEDQTYANDQLVMKWNEAWDLCNDYGNDDITYCLGAWTSNEWNGMMPDGTQSVWHYKIIWVGSAGEASPYWLPGGYLIWGNYETIMDQGVDSSGHQVYAHATPNGYGA